MNWSPILSKFKTDPRLQDFECVAYDLLAHGRRGAESLPEPIDLETVARDLLRQIPDGPFIGVGHSYGLRPLLEISAWHPDRLKQLVVEDSSPVLSGAGFGQLTSIFDEVPFPCASREEAKRILESIYGEGQLSKFLLSNVREIQPGVHDWRFPKATLQVLLKDAQTRHLWKEWENYPGPVSMIVGKNSAHVSPSRVEECVSRRLGKVTDVEWIEGAGHWVHADQPQLFFEALVRSLIKA